MGGDKGERRAHKVAKTSCGNVTWNFGMVRGGEVVIGMSAVREGTGVAQTKNAGTGDASAVSTTGEQPCLQPKGAAYE